MNQDKIGKFIAECREEKNLTQKELAEKIEVDRTTVSKWERGICLPDVLLLQRVCKILDVQVEEFLAGQRFENLDKIDSKTLEAIKYYNKKTRKKYLKILLLSILIALSIITTTIIVNNYNKMQFSDIIVDEDNFHIEGYKIYNKSKKILTIDNIKFKDKNIGTIEEIKAQEIEFCIYSNQKIIYGPEKIINNENLLTEDLLRPIHFVIVNNDSKVKLEDIFMTIKILDDKSETKTYGVSLK